MFKDYPKFSQPRDDWNYKAGQTASWLREDFQRILIELNALLAKQG